MGKVHVVIKIRLQFYNEYFVGGGKGSGMVDSFILKDAHYRPYIPASSLKGRLRYNMGILLKTLASAEPCGSDAGQGQCGCMICRLFGRSGNSRGALYFEDLHLENSAGPQDDFSARTGIAISRYSKKVRDGALYTLETGGKGGKQTFSGEVEGYMEEDEYRCGLTLLYGSFKMIYSLGGGQSRGLGWIDDCSEFKVYVDRKEIEAETIMKWGECFALSDKA